jgi:multimeric flavodoxin WrbA
MNSVLGLYLSPREGGNSDLLLDEFLRGCKEAGAAVQAVTARKLEIEGCIECGGCDETGECILTDDMDEVYPLLLATKRLVVASPIFFYGLPAHGKALVDRSQALWNRVRLNPELRRGDGRGFFIGVGATKGQNLFDGTNLTIKYFLDAVGLPLKMDSLTFRQVEKKGAIMDHPAALHEAYQAGRAFVF